MAWFKRISLFLLVNFLVIITLSFLLHLFGVRPYLNRYGIDYNQLALFALIWGMGGAFISLALSRKMAKWLMGVKVIDPETRDPELRDLVQLVHHLARSAGLATLPQVGIYESPEPNAFATGPTRSRSLVAVSSGLLQRMNPSELEGVLGHEITHITNGDMVTMTLLQGVVNAFVIFLARAIAFAITQAGRDRDDNRRSGFGSYFLVQFALEIVFMMLGSIVVAAFSRYREFRADAGGARLAGREKMVGALQALQRTFELADPRAPKALQIFKISSRSTGWLRLFATHPPLEERIRRLQSPHNIP